MISYNPTENYNASVYIMQVEDPIQGGVDGIDNLAIQQLTKNVKYLKKFKGTIIIGSVDPSGNYNLSIDYNSQNNLLYLNETRGSFWKPIVSGSMVTSWTNITKLTVMNIAGISINSLGNDNSFQSLTFEDGVMPGDSQVSIIKWNNRPGNLQLGKITFKDATTLYNRLGYINDTEILSNYTVEQESGNIDPEKNNNNGGLRVKNFEGLVQNDKLFHYDIVSQTWNVIDANGSFLHLNIGGIVFNGLIVTEFEDDVMIQTQAEFDLFFNTQPDGEKTIISQSNQETSVLLKPGVYELRNRVEILKPYRIKCMDGAWIKLHKSLKYTTDNSTSYRKNGFYNIKNETYTPSYYGGYAVTPPPPYGPYPLYKPVYGFTDRYTRSSYGDWYSIDKANFIVLSDNVDLDIHVDFDNVYIRNLIDITYIRKMDICIRIKNASCDALVYSNVLNRNSEIKIFLDDSFNSNIRHKYNFFNISGAYITGSFKTPLLKTFESSSQIIINAVWNGLIKLETGNYNI
jgi:hypothetical protein